MSPRIITFSLSTTVADVASNQGVATNAATNAGTGARWVTGKDTTSRTLIKYADNTWSSPSEVDLSASLPVGATQINGSCWWSNGGTNYVVSGWSNFSTTPEAGGYVVTNGDTMVWVRNVTLSVGHSEGGGVRPGTDEYWCVSNNESNIERVRLTDDTTLNTYAVGFGTYDATIIYQGLAWVDNDHFLVTRHNTSLTSTWDLYRYDSGTDTIATVARFTSATVGGNTAGQAPTTTTDRSELWVASRDATAANSDVGIFAISNIPMPRYPVVKNAASSQATSLELWMLPSGDDPGTRTATGLFKDYSGNARDADVYTHNAWVTLLPSLGYAMHFHNPAANTGYAETASGWNTTAFTAFTVDMTLVVRSTATGMIVVDGNATGANVGDWQIQVNATTAGRIRFRVSDSGGTLNDIFPAGTLFTNDVPFRLTIRGGASGIAMYVDGVSVGTLGAGAYRLCGNSNPLRFGQALGGTNPSNVDLWDFRIYSADMGTGYVAAVNAAATKYELWMQGSGGLMLAGVGT